MNKDMVMELIAYNKRLFWSVILLACISMIGVALFYQYALGYEPCVLCVHIRAWVIALGLVSAVSLVVPSTGFRLASLIVSVGFLVMFSANVVELWQIETGYEIGSCSWSAGFPEYLPLNEWAPFLFEIGGICGQSPEMIFGVSMAQGLILVALVLVAIFLMSQAMTIRLALASSKA